MLPGKRFTRREDGTVAIETAIVFPIFIALVYAILEIGLLNLRVAFTEDRIDGIARKIANGQTVAAGEGNGDTPDACASGDACFAEEVCAALDLFVDCDLVGYEVRVFETYEAASAARTDEAPCPDGEIPPRAYDPGKGDEIVRFRVCVPIETITPNIGWSLADLPGNRRGVIAGHVFRNQRFRDRPVAAGSP